MRVTWITAQEDGSEHEVTDEGVAAAQRGVFRGRCGARFLAASMDVGPCRRCLGCGARLRRRAE